MKTAFYALSAALALLMNAPALQAKDLPAVLRTVNGSQLIVDGKPFLILGGELGNSSAGTAEQADVVLPRLATLNVNTVLMPVAWEQVEPEEGKFDFSILDHWIDVARQQHLHLILLWFGSWKNAFSNYTPVWVKQDTKRFPRAMSAEGGELEILSTLSLETLKSDGRAFSTLMGHVHTKDAEQQTVLMVQVENEVGYLGRGRDRSAIANRDFHSAVPRALMQRLNDHRSALSPELSSHFHPQGITWSEVFGEAADEVFMAWNYAVFIEKVTAAGKHSYALPMFVNCQLPAPTERAGEYPSGGPHPYYLEVYRAAAPSIDFYSPDIYWPNFEYWIQRYRHEGTPVFVPEARLETAPLNAIYAYGEAAAFGFSAFGIDSIEPTTDIAGVQPAISQTYSALRDLADLIIPAQATGKTRALILHADSPRPTQTVALGGYLFEATLSRSWPAKSLLTQDGAMTIIESAPNEFFITGRGLTVSFVRDPDVDARVAGIATIEEVSKAKDHWIVNRRLNGDQSNQGRQLSLAPNRIGIFRVMLYATERQRSAIQ